MNAKKPRCTRICECGQEFRTSAKFGNETMCDACYKAHSQEFLDWFDSLSDKQQRKAFDALTDVAADLGIDVDACGAANQAQARQVHCDRVASDLLADVEI